MKTVFLIIGLMVISLNMTGQEPEKESGLEDCLSGLALESFNKALQEYFEVCYNDSTPVEKCIYEIMYLNRRRVITDCRDSNKFFTGYWRYIKDTVIFEHNRQPDFIDFGTWLNDKLK